MVEKKIEVDISGQIQQLNYDSALGFRRDNGLEKSVFLRSKDKKEIIKKYQGQVTDLIEKIHCILIYYCIKDSLECVREIKVCRDVNFRRVKKLLPFLFKEIDYFNEIEIKPRSGSENQSLGHNIALRTFRKKKFAELIIKKEMIEEQLFKFKGK
ncbi:MAG: hypothetical protein ABIH37_02795 [archaeon]